MKQKYKDASGTWWTIFNSGNRVKCCNQDNGANDAGEITLLQADALRAKHRWIKRRKRRKFITAQFTYVL